MRRAPLLPKTLRLKGNRGQKVAPGMTTGMKRMSWRIVLCAEIWARSKMTMQRAAAAIVAVKVGLAYRYYEYIPHLPSGIAEGTHQ